MGGRKGCGRARGEDAKKLVGWRESVRGAVASARPPLVAALGALALAGAGRAQSAPRRLTVDTLASTVRFDGRSTLGAFSATTHTLAGWAEVTDARILSGRGAVEVRAATLRTGIGLRDRHLRSELDTDRYPTIGLTVEHVVAGDGAAAASGLPVVLEGTLTVKGTPHAVRFPATAALRGDTLVVAGRAPLTFTQLGMKPPTRLLVTHVQDAFVLVYDIRIRPAGS